MNIQVSATDSTQINSVYYLFIIIRPIIILKLIDTRRARSGFRYAKEMFYVTTHSTHFICGYMASNMW